jgi:hypothetical protein
MLTTKEKFPPPPGYYKQFENSKKDMQKPDLNVLRRKGHTLFFNGEFFPVGNFC